MKENQSGIVPESGYRLHPRTPCAQLQKITRE